MIIRFLLSSITFFSTVQCFQRNLNITTGILNARTVIHCGVSIDVYSTFDLSRIHRCPFVSISNDKFQPVHLKITEKTNKIIQLNILPRSIILPNISKQISNESHTNDTRFYLAFHSELTCRYSTYLVCFYYNSTTNFHHVEDLYDHLVVRKQASFIKRRFHFRIIYLIIGILTLSTCLLALYLLCCTEKLSGEHLIRLDFIVDPILARETALKLAPEPV